MTALNSLPVCLPQLPLAKYILPYLEQIDRNRWYSNYGPLVREFIARTATLFGLESTEVICAATGTTILELCIKALAIPKNSLCIMPAWTFVATPLAAVNAGLQPFFVDVDRETQALNPETLVQQLPSIAKHGTMGAVIVVAPFGMPIATQQWDHFTEKTGIPVIIDAAAGFDTLLHASLMPITHTPVMVSLHATKTFGIGEGGLLLCKNKSLVAEVERLTQFGFPRGIRNAESVGTNAKLSEYTAAIGLAAHDQWMQTREAWQTITYAYQTSLDEIGISHLFSSQWVTSTANIILPQCTNKIAEDLKTVGIETRKWWGEGCQQQPVFHHALHTALPNTDYLRASVLGLPFYIGMQPQSIHQVVMELEKAMSSFALSALER